MRQVTSSTRLKSIKKRVNNLEGRKVTLEEDEELDRMIADAERLGRESLERFNLRFGHCFTPGKDMGEE